MSTAPDDPVRAAQDAAEAAVDKQADNIERTVDKTALRKVRGLVDELEAEQNFFQRQQKWFMAGGILLLAVVLTLFSLRKSGEQPDAARLACEQREWQSAHAAATAALKHRHPDMTHVDIQRMLEAEREKMMREASKACESVPRG